MVKNTKGGSSHKKLARKNVQNTNVRQRTRYANPDEPCEMYAVVTKMYGQGNCEVMCNDGKKRLCVIRKKFKGRNKRNNMISLDSLLLIGTRDWEVVSPDKKEKCDLLEVYERYMYKDIKKDPNCNSQIFKINNEEQQDEEEYFEFDYDSQFNNAIFDNNGDVKVDDI